MKLSDFDFDLPDALIAQTPPVQHGGSRLLVPKGAKSNWDSVFSDLSHQVRAGDLLVFNDTKVIPARFFGQKDSGGKIECLAERVLGQTRLLVQMKASHPPKSGQSFSLIATTADPNARATVVERQGQFYVLDISEPVLALLAKIGELPLPPYITRKAGDDDDSRYQTVYAREPGAVAAPTAGLHFTQEHLAQLAAQGIGQAFLTLHVGAGTFSPVRTDNLAEHKMHSEWYEIPQATVEAIARTKANGGRVISVGTTSLRALESAARHAQGPIQAGTRETDIFIIPGYQFQVVDMLITNFHLPKSTLMMLVSAFAGFDEIKQIYAHAIAQQYRFFSYGDAMLLTRKPHA